MCDGNRMIKKMNEIGPKFLPFFKKEKIMVPNFLKKMKLLLFFQINKYSRRAYLGEFLACVVGLLVEASQAGFLVWL